MYIYKGALFKSDGHFRSMIGQSSCDHSQSTTCHSPKFTLDLVNTVDGNPTPVGNYETLPGLE